MKILVNSLPKSGTHLLGSLIASIGFENWDGPGLTGALIRQTHRNPLKNWKKNWRRTQSDEDGLWVDLDIERNYAKSTWLSHYLNCLPNDAYIYGHLPYSQELSEFLQAHDFKLFYISRDPRDVLLSYINFQKNRENFPFHKEFQEASFDEAIESTLTSSAKNGIVSAPLSDRIQRSIGWLSDHATCTVKFEDLVGPNGGGSSAKQLGCIRRVTSHLGLSLNKKQLSQLSRNVFDTNSRTFHKGMINQWQETFTEDQRDRVNQNLGHFITWMNYSL